MDIAYNNGWNIMTSWCYEEDRSFFCFEKKIFQPFISSFWALLQNLINNSSIIAVWYWTSAEYVIFRTHNRSQTFSKNGRQINTMKVNVSTWKAQLVGSASEQSYQGNRWPARICWLNLCHGSSPEAFGLGRECTACSAWRERPLHRIYCDNLKRQDPPNEGFINHFQEFKWKHKNTGNYNKSWWLYVILNS